MSRVTLNVFGVKTQTFLHTIDYDTDATYITDENGNDVFTVDSSGYVTRGNNPARVAKFKMYDSKYWMYDSTDFSPIPRIIRCENDYLIKVELFVFRTLLQEEMCTSSVQAE